MLSNVIAEHAALDLEIVEPSKNLAQFLSQVVPESFAYAFTAIDIDDPKFAIGREQKRFHSAASVAKLYIATEVLRQISTDQLRTDDLVTVAEINCVGDSNGLTHRERVDSIEPGDQIAVEDLVEIMLSVSSNTAANVLIDLVGRESINKNVIAKYGWQGSEVTRKYLPRTKEVKGYIDAPATVTCSLHVAELLFRVETKTLVNEFVSQKIKQYLTDSRRDGDLTIDPAELDGYFHKIGSLEVAAPVLRRWQHDAGVGEQSSRRMALCVLTCYEPTETSSYFPLSEVQRMIFRHVFESKES